MRLRLPLALLFAALGACAGPADPTPPADGPAPVGARALASEIDEAQLAKERLRFLTLAPAAPIARLDDLVREVRRPGAGAALDVAIGAVKAAYEREGVKGVTSSDVEAMAFLVLMQAAHSAQEDLRAIMASVKALGAAGEGGRVVLERLGRDLAANAGAGAGDPIKPAPDGCLILGAECAAVAGVAGEGVDAELVDALVRRAYGRAAGGGLLTKDDLVRTIGAMKNEIDSLSEMGEMESLRLQMAMDRMSKMMSTLSNILKKISDTGSTIIQNMK
ncbi:MAG TPA: hypothetical protein VFS00_02335 [Polyangiaceae bacterium]|nr:hypothetical protein [Polyangiaceae bacterium]